MASLQDIKRRISSVKNTLQITKAMKMVAAAKFRRAQLKMAEARPYSVKMADVITAITAGIDRESHPLLAKRDGKSVEVILITGDRGLCSSFNTNALKAADKLIKQLKSDGHDVSVCAVGRKSKAYFKREGIEPLGAWEGLSGGKVDYASATAIAREVIKTYEDGAMDEVYLVYNEFRSVLAQEVITKKLLPFEENTGDIAEDAPVFLFEPSIDSILGRILPKYIEVQLYQALLESQAAEEAARMNAMENATQAANDMIETLTLDYNKVRQASITAELMDIIGGAEAVKQ